jgi:hypothetical protein
VGAWFDSIGRLVNRAGRNVVRCPNVGSRVSRPKTVLGETVQCVQATGLVRYCKGDSSHEGGGRGV